MANVYPAFGGTRWAIQHDDGRVQGYFDTREQAERAMVPAPATADINFLTCTMDDVIARSILMHSSMLTDMLRSAARTHAEASRTMVDGPAVRMAREMAIEAGEVAQRVDTGLLASAADCACLTFSQRMIAFGAAYKLQCVPMSLALEIAARCVPTGPDND